MEFYLDQQDIFLTIVKVHGDVTSAANQRLFADNALVCMNKDAIVPNEQPHYRIEMHQSSSEDLSRRLYRLNDHDTPLTKSEAVDTNADERKNGNACLASNS